MALPPRIPSSLQKPKTLLLAGGVFGLGLALVWFFCTYRFVREPAGGIPEGAQAIAYFDRGVPEPLRKALGIEAGARALIVRPDGDIVPSDIRVVTAGTRRAIPRSADGYGHANVGGRVTPLTMVVGETGIRITVGRVPRGLRPLSAAVSTGTGLRTIPSSTKVYYSDPDPSTTLVGHSPIHLGISPILSALHGQTEAIVLDETSGKGSFVVHSRPLGSAPIDRRALDEAIRDYIGYSAPAYETTELEDATPSTEKRSSRKDVRLEERGANAVLTKRFTSEDKSLVVTYAIDSAGDLWLGDNTQRIQEVLSTNPVNNSVGTYSCSGSNKAVHMVVYQSGLWKNDLFTALGITFDDMEFGGLTVCGYFR